MKLEKKGNFFGEAYDFRLAVENQIEFLIFAQPNY